MKKDDILFRLVKAPSPHLAAELKQRFQQSGLAIANPKNNKQTREVVELISRAELYAKERKLRAAEKKTKEQARKKRESAIAREKYIESLVGREKSIWEKVDELIKLKKAGKYDEAVKLLVDLRDLNKKTGTEKAFNQKLKMICENHSRKWTFLYRLESAGLIELTNRNEIFIISKKSPADSGC